MLGSVVLGNQAPGGFSYNRFSGPVSGKIIEVQVPAAQGIPAQQHADYGYDHRAGKIDPETAKYDRLKTVDYKVCTFNILPHVIYLFRLMLLEFYDLLGVYLIISRCIKPRTTVDQMDEKKMSVLQYLHVTFFMAIC